MGGSLVGRGGTVMPGAPIFSQTIDMEGFRTLRVEARLLDGATRTSLPVTLLVEGSIDLGSERKSWAGKAEPMNLNPGTYSVGHFQETGRLARVRLEVPDGLSLGHVWVRLTRLD